MDGFLNGQSAGAGYDLATGLGSVNATNLANNWNSITFLPSQTQLQVPITTFVHGTAVSVSGAIAAISGNGKPTGTVSLVRMDRRGKTLEDLVIGADGSFSSTSIYDLPGGQYALTAHYGGDTTYAPSDSNAIALTVAPENSTTTLTAVGLQGSFLPDGGLTGPTRQSTGNFRYGKCQRHGYGAGWLDNCRHVSAGAGRNCVYSHRFGSGVFLRSWGTLVSRNLLAGDNSFIGSNSSALDFSVGKSKPTVIVGVNINSVSTTQPIGAHVNVVGFGGATATGTVQFAVDGTPYGSPITLQAGGLFNTSAQASILITGLSGQSYSIGLITMAVPTLTI